MVSRKDVQHKYYYIILFYSQFDINIKLTKREIISKNKMEERKAIESVPNDEYLRIVPIIGKYIKNKYSSPIFKYKCPLFAAAGNKGRIYISSNSLEHMGTFYGHKARIGCLCAMSHKILASGSWDNTIKIWDIENRAIMSTLSQHTEYVVALCYMEEGKFVSGSKDNSLIIWSNYELPGSSSTSTYSHRVLTRFKSEIRGIIRISNREIMCGELSGDLRIWDIVEGVCTKHIILSSWGWITNYIYQMKQHMGEVAVSFNKEIKVWGAANNWGNTPLKQFGVCDGYSIEFLTSDILLRGGDKGQLEFIDNGEIGCSLHPILGLHSSYIVAIQRIANNIVITISDEGSIKVIDPILRKCYLNFKKGDDIWMNAIAYFY